MRLGAGRTRYRGGRGGRCSRSTIFDQVRAELTCSFASSVGVSSPPHLLGPLYLRGPKRRLTVSASTPCCPTSCRAYWRTIRGPSPRCAGAIVIGRTPSPETRSPRGSLRRARTAASSAGAVRIAVTEPLRPGSSAPRAAIDCQRRTEPAPGESPHSGRRGSQCGRRADHQRLARRAGTSCASTVAPPHP